MSERFEHPDPPPDERAVRRLSDRSGVDVGKVRALFRYEFSRLRMGSKVGTYLAVLTAANVRGMLRRTARRPEVGRAAVSLDRDPRHDTPGAARNLHRWEDDGGGPSTT